MDAVWKKEYNKKVWFGIGSSGVWPMVKLSNVCLIIVQIN